MEDTLNVALMRQSRGYYYLATPYSKYPDGLKWAFEDACQAAAWLIEQGIHVYCPIAHTHPIAKCGKINPTDHGFWIPADRPLMYGAVGLIVCMMPSWEQSTGIGLEIDEFIDQDKPICYMEWDPTLPNGGRDAR